MSEYNGEKSAVSAAESLWRALLDLNASDLDPTYRPRLAIERAGSPYTAVRDALLSVLTVIVEDDGWLTHVTSPRQVAESIYEALCESGETVAYHLARLRRNCLAGPVLTLEVRRESTGAALYAYATVGGTLNSYGDGRQGVDCERVPGGHLGEFSAYVGDAHTPEHLTADSWVDLAHAIARFYRLSGAVRVSTQGDPRKSEFSVAYGDPRATNAPA